MCWVKFQCVPEQSAEFFKHIGEVYFITLLIEVVTVTDVFRFERISNFLCCLNIFFADINFSRKRISRIWSKTRQFLFVELFKRINIGIWVYSFLF